MSSSTQVNDATRRGYAPFASDPARSRGRLFRENASPTRGEFQRDRDRIVHCTAFRRLAHKTQVFVPMQGDHYRTRLTHTIEVAQIARSLARAIGLDDDLAEAVALAHDLGHTPFGHTGEDALDAVMRPYGGFDHNAHALRIVTELERRYAAFDGLNLTWETLEGLVKHNGPLRSAAPAPICAFDARFPLDLDSFAGPEAQAAALADDIAYNAHDIDDGLRAGLFDIADLKGVPFLAGLIDEIGARHPGLERVRVIHELGRRLITRFVEDVIAETARRSAGLASAEAVRGAGRATVAFSEPMAEADRSIKAFLFPNMYRHRSVVAVRAKADIVVRDVFRGFFANVSDMPAEWRPAPGASEIVRARAVADYIAGMTDRFALSEHRRLFDVTPDLV